VNHIHEDDFEIYRTAIKVFAAKVTVSFLPIGG
jgi:hypothetical protein